MSVNHSDATSVVLEAIMKFMELELAAKAPHDIILFDSSLASPLIYINKAMFETQGRTRSYSQSFLAREDPKLRD